MTDSNLTLADPAADVRGKTLVDRYGDEVGTVEDLIIDIFDEKNPQVRLLLVGSGGFLGIGEQQVLIPTDAVTSVTEQVHVDTEREYVAGGPAYDPDLKLQQDNLAGLYDYYGMLPYWDLGYRAPGFPFR